VDRSCDHFVSTTITLAAPWDGSINTSVHKTTPLISVVIPSRQRPALVVRAVHSVIAQERDDLEIIVVLDGDTAGSAEVLRGAFPGEARLRIVENIEQSGPPVARNRGIGAARGKWIAHLDDDDTWLPGKLEKQLALALASRYAEPVVTCQFYTRAAGVEQVQRIPPPSLPMSEYLFVRSERNGGTGSVLPSTTLAPRSLLLRVPFIEPRHEDCEWAMRASLEPTVGWEFVAEPLAVWNCDDDGRERNSTSREWRYSLEFARSHKHLMTRRGYAGFVLSRCTYSALRRKKWLALAPILADAIRNGSPTAKELLLAIHMWLGISAAGRWLQPRLLGALRLFRRVTGRDRRHDTP
jgi:glycosyltransferase involved in cell wall biosynthesis